MTDLENSYATVDELRDALRDTLTANDPAYSRALLAASRRVNNFCGRNFGQTLTAKEFRSSSSLLLWIPDLATDDNLVIKTGKGNGTFTTTTWTSDQYELSPADGGVSEPYNCVRAINGSCWPTPSYWSGRTVEVTGKWGWPSVPDPVRAATIIIATAIFRSTDYSGAATFAGGHRVPYSASRGPMGPAAMPPEARDLLLEYTHVALA